MANPYEFVRRRQRGAALKYGPGPGEGVGVAPGSLTPDRAGQDRAQRELSDAQAQAAMAGGLGTAAGGALGAGIGALGFLAGPEVGVPAMLGGAGLGAQIGGNLGSAWGDSKVQGAQTEMDKQRRKAMEQEALMQAIMSLRGM